MINDTIDFKSKLWTAADKVTNSLKSAIPQLKLGA